MYKQLYTKSWISLILGKDMIISAVKRTCILLNLVRLCVSLSLGHKFFPHESSRSSHNILSTVLGREHAEGIFFKKINTYWDTSVDVWAFQNMYTEALWLRITWHFFTCECLPILLSFIKQHCVKMCRYAERQNANICTNLQNDLFQSGNKDCSQIY